MAIFRSLQLSKLPTSLLETPGKIYIEGQAHDASTLTPLFNDTLCYPTGSRIPAASSKYGLPLTPMSNRFMSAATVQVTTNSSGVCDYTTVDCNQNIAQTAAPMKYRDNTVFIPSGDNYANGAYPGMFVDMTTGAPVSQFSTVTGVSYDGPAMVVYEGLDDFIVVQAMASYHLGAVANYRSSSVQKINKATGAASVLFQGAADSQWNLHLVHQDDNNLYFWVCSWSTTIMASTFRWVVVSKATMTTTSTTSYENTQGKPASKMRPSKAVPIDANNYVVFNAMKNSESGDLFKFIAYTFSKDAPSVVTSETIVPTGGASMPGTVRDTAHAEYKVLHFYEEGFHYYVVVPSQPGSNASLIDNLNYLHIYSAPESNPKEISYLNSVKLNQAAKIINIMPLDENASKLVSVGAGSGVDFLVWNKTAKTYVLTSNSPISVAFLCVDQTGRIWANDDAIASSLHMFGPSISNTIRVGFADNRMKYSGTTIDTSISVSAFNFMGERILNNVSLQIDGNSATFDDGTTTRTVSTRSDGDLVVPIKITASGFVQVLASLAI